MDGQIREWEYHCQSYPIWNIRDELSVIDGIILKSDRIVVPLATRKKMLQRIHHGHMGSRVEAKTSECSLLAFDEQADSWNGIEVHRISWAQKGEYKEPMIPVRVPTIPWEVVATDLFSFDNLDYLFIVDYHSRYFEVIKLPDTKSSTVIKYTKSIFSRHIWDSCRSRKW